MQLRDYQQDAIEKIRKAYANGFKAPLYVLSTGGGKTVTFSFIAKNASAKGNRICILTHRKELIAQTSKALWALDVPHGIILAGRSSTHDAVQVASVQTLVRRTSKYKPFDLLIIDECHHTPSNTYKQILAAYPDAKRLGVTATPCRTDGKGLKELFDILIEGVDIQWLIQKGYLSPPVVYAPPMKFSLEGVKTRMGDYAKDEIEKLMSKPTITGDAIEHYRKLAHKIPAIAFCVSVAHAQEVAYEFKAAGYNSESIDGTMTPQKRAELITGLGNGSIDVLTSCDLISEGVDVPVVGCAIMLRPTKSTGLFLQATGRTLRPYPGKTKAIILDHVGNTLRHGLPSEIRDWSLESGQVKRKSKDKEPSVKIRQCLICYTVHAPAPVCPNCGHVYEVASREIETVDGELKELTPEMLYRNKRREEGKAQTLEQLRALAKSRGYHPKWAEHRYNARIRKQGGGI